MTWFDSLVTRVARIERGVRIALATACAERCLPVYQALREDADEAAFTEALAVGQRVAETGERSPARELELERRLRTLVEDYLDMGYSVLSDAVTVVLRVVQSLDEDESASATAVARALASALSVADGAEAMMLPPARETSGAFQAEEEAWQTAAMDLAEGWHGSVRRGMFASIPPTDGPAWQRRFLSSRR